MLDKYCITEFQYCLPKLIVESKKYRNFYSKHQNVFTIMDMRKMGWKKEPEDFGIVEKALSMVTPDLVILPSYMYELGRTLEVGRRFLEEFKPKHVAGCLEGTTYEEVEACKDCLKEMGVGAFASPSHLYKTYKEDVQVYIENHLHIKELGGLDGILVTSLPVRLGLLGRLVSDYLPSPPSLNFYEEENNFPLIVERNIKEVLTYYEERVER